MLLMLFSFEDSIFILTLFWMTKTYLDRILDNMDIMLFLGYSHVLCSENYFGLIRKNSLIKTMVAKALEQKCYMLLILKYLIINMRM
jgi:hypothetical protein